MGVKDIVSLVFFLDLFRFRRRRWAGRRCRGGTAGGTLVPNTTMQVGICSLDIVDTGRLHSWTQHKGNEPVDVVPRVWFLEVPIDAFDVYFPRFPCSTSVLFFWYFSGLLPPKFEYKFFKRFCFCKSLSWVMVSYRRRMQGEAAIAVFLASFGSVYGR